jgi:hypothetical protein
MRITQEKLLSLAREEAERQADRDDVLSGYVIGSVARGDPLIGGAADIDLVLIHAAPPLGKREIKSLSNDIHLDITHYHQTEFEHPRSIRTDPWLGPSVCEPKFIYDPDHFFEWAQASVRGQFHRSDFILGRADQFLTRAREAKLRCEDSNPWLADYLRSALFAGNAAVSLIGFPGAGRRAGAAIHAAAAKLEEPFVWDGFARLLGLHNFNDWKISEWLSDWGRAFDAAAAGSYDPALSEPRRDYYLRAFQALADERRVHEFLWTLLATWDQSQQALAGDSNWAEVRARLGLDDLHRDTQLDQLEDYLDSMEDLLLRWAEKSGAKYGVIA